MITGKKSTGHEPADDNFEKPAHGRKSQTPQLLPLNPMVIRSPSTITGTRRLPSDNFNMCSRLFSSFTTSIYSTAMFFAL